MVKTSLFKSDSWSDSLRAAAIDSGVDPGRALLETDRSSLAEGLYVKWEHDGRVVERYKWVRPVFLNAILDSGSHWRDRPIIRNGLKDDVDLFLL